jgi:phosphoribosylaminoimidazolecarboxamide formyltransferase/IMP cyclohydrolase
LENIDIGGPNMIRAAAKNFKDVVVIVNPNKYAQVLRELKSRGDVSKETRSRLAIDAFKETAKYDWIIQKFLEKKETSPVSFPETLNLKYQKIQDLRYGENSHQKAAMYKEIEMDESCVINAEQLHGKKLSWTNVLDLNSALELVKEFEEPTVAIIKHMSPCGVACGSNIYDAFEKAHECDPLSAFGGIVACNRKIDLDTCKRMASFHFDSIITPSFDRAGLKLLKKRRAIRLLEAGKLSLKPRKYMDIASVNGGLLIQEHDSNLVEEKYEVVTKTKPSDRDLESLKFAWKVVKYVKSNAIVLVKGKRTVGIGPGQTSRIGSVKIAIKQAKDNVKNSFMASDGFFPFRDSIDEAVKSGIKAIIQPGGSIRDKKVIDAANEHGIAMVFTGLRAFRH